MSLTQDVIERPELTKFRQAENEIKRMEAEFMPMKVDGVNDKKGLDTVHNARMIVKNLRVTIEKKRKELKADALEYGRLVDSVAKQLADMIEPIESHLEYQENIVKREQERIKKEQEEAKQRILQMRIDAMTAVGKIVNPVLIAAWDDTEFQQQYEAAKAEKIERERLAEEEATRKTQEAEQRRIELEKLAAERKLLEEAQAKQREEQAKIDAERRKLEDEKAAQQRAIELEKAKQEAAEKARKDEQERIAREAEQKRLHAEREEQERKRIEFEKPMRERVESFASKIEMIPAPDGLPPKIHNAINLAMVACVREIRKIAKQPME